MDSHGLLIVFLVSSVSGGYINLANESNVVTYDNISALKNMINAELQEEIEALQDSIVAANKSTDVMWLILSACLVFWMQAGFALVEVGSVSMKNTKNILVKNLMDACIGCISFYLIGYAFAFGGNNGFIGGDNFALVDVHKTIAPGVYYDGSTYAFFMFQFAFAATASTIVSGAVAERCRVTAYFVYSFCLTVFIYPVVVHWVWSDYGWASAFVSSEDLLFKVGVIDFAGSSVVHMVGGTTALVGAIFLGPRRGRFSPKKFKLAQQSAAFQTLGVLILWFGWYGFNCGSTLTMEGSAADVAGSVAATTTIAATSAGLTSSLIGYLVEGHLSIHRTNNGILGGLVSITAGCAVVTPEIAVVIGVCGGLVYFGSSLLLVKLKIDDVVDASPVHMFCGAWGTLAAGIFAHPQNTAMAYGTGSCGLFYSCDGNGGLQFAANLCFVLAVLAWSAFFGVVVFGILKALKCLRVDLETERIGLDTAEHGGGAYEIEAPVRRQSVFVNKTTLESPKLGNNAGHNTVETVAE